MEKPAKQYVDHTLDKVLNLQSLRRKSMEYTIIPLDSQSPSDGDQQAKEYVEEVLSRALSRDKIRLQSREPPLRHSMPA